MEAMRVLVVDDHPMWRESLARDLADAGYRPATAGDAAQAVRVAAATRPHVAVVDLGLPDTSGVALIPKLSALDEPPRILMLSASGESDDVLAAVTAGATGYLVKSATTAEFLDAVRRTAAGEPVFTPGLAGLVLGEYRRLAAGPPPDRGERPTLTERETEVLQMVATGSSYKEIAAQLHLSHRTVQNHVQNILRKLQLHNRVQLTRYALGTDPGSG